MKNSISCTFTTVVALCVIVLISVFAFLNSTAQLTSTSVAVNGVDKPLNGKRFAEAVPAKSFESVNDTAYVFLGLGATAHQLNCQASIESLVRYGGWSGKIFLITDQGNCFDDALIIKNAGMEAKNYQKIVVKEDFGSGGIDIWNPKVGFSKNRLRSKSMKTQLFEVIQDPAIQVLAYVDCDILFGQEGCPARFVRAGAPWEENKIKFSRIGTDSAGHLTNIHSGTIVMHRQHSAEVLQRWYERLSSGVDDMDRTSYLLEYSAVQNELDRRANASNSHHAHPDNTSATHIATQQSPHGHQDKQQQPRSLRVITPENAATSGEYVKPIFLVPATATSNVMMPSELIYYNGSGAKFHYELFVDPNAETLPCMMHVSKARCESMGRAVVQKAVDRFHLRTYNQGYLYCPNPTVAPVLYGWFPLSYLPFCPKIEIFG